MLEKTTPVTQAGEVFRVVEVYGTHRLLGGVKQVVAMERAHGPFLTLAAAQKRKQSLKQYRRKAPRPNEIPGAFTIEKGTVVWQETSSLSD
ncbi:hypothetical protein [Glutamicibacter creatinolyticus]|uniref:hypothetical protein n=1 Tax=Glutamicibacter creatinolyticus TaxID=162496 RepID=UPI0032164E94